MLIIIKALTLRKSSNKLSTLFALRFFTAKRAKDDGNGEDFYRRVKLWDKQNDGLRDQYEADVHEFDNGFKVPNAIWDKLYT